MKQIILIVILAILTTIAGYQQASIVMLEDRITVLETNEDKVIEILGMLSESTIEMRENYRIWVANGAINGGE